MAVWGWVIVAIVVIVLATSAWGMWRRRQGRLRQPIGPEDDQAVTESGTRMDAESELEAKRRRHEVHEA